MKKKEKSKEYTSLETKIKNMKVPRDDSDRTEYQGMSSVIRDVLLNKKQRDNPSSETNNFRRQQYIVKNVIDEETDLTYDILIEAVKQNTTDPEILDTLKKISDSTTLTDQKKSLALIIANSMARTSTLNKDVKALVILLAALVLLNTSDGKDVLIQVARRLLTVGLTVK